MQYLPHHHKVIDYIRDYTGSLPIYDELKELKAGKAAINGDLKILQKISASNHSSLLERDNAGWQPLRDATLQGHENIASFLLKQGAD